MSKKLIKNDNNNNKASATRDKIQLDASILKAANGRNANAAQVKYSTFYHTYI
ncbi:MAG TPA: hypothetical protein VIP56_00575 [Nitrososphaeraceae archaeon]